MNEIISTEQSKDKFLKLLADTIAKGASESELELFAQVCARTQLDPFARQIYAVKRYDKSLGREVMGFQCSIDGFRVVAQRSGEYTGQVGPYWCDQSGKWFDVWLSDKLPSAAKVGVLRKGFTHPIWAVARFEAYAQTTKDGRLNSMWTKMPDVMIAKCAESLALRRAFPQELSGLYTGEEMGQADNQETDIEKKQINIDPNSFDGFSSSPKGEIKPTVVVMPIGKKKGTPLTEISPEDLGAAIKEMEKMLPNYEINSRERNKLLEYIELIENFLGINDATSSP